MNRQTGAATPKIPKGFVLVNLSENEQEEMRRLARECGAELRGVLRCALINVRFQLKQMVEQKKKAGLNTCGGAQ
jgi:hypothetical protein